MKEDCTLKKEKIIEKEIEKLKISFEKERLRLKKLGVSIENFVLSNQNIEEIIGKFPTPMTSSLFNFCFAHNGAIRIGRNTMGYEIGDELNEEFQVLVCGQPRCSIMHDALSHRIKGIPLENYSILLKYYLSRIERDQALANYPELYLYNEKPDNEFLKKVFGEKIDKYKIAYDNFISGIKDLEKNAEKNFNEVFMPSWNEMVVSLKDNAEKAESKKEILEVLRETVQQLRINACVNFVIVTRLGFFAYARLNESLCKIYGQKEGKTKLDILTGLMAKKSPASKLMADLRKLKNREITLEQVIKEHGHKSALCELEIKNPRYWEQPNILISQSEQIENENHYLYKENDEVIIRNDHPLLTEDINAARTYLTLRETARFEQLKGLDIVRQMLKKIEKSFSWPDDLVFFLTIEEIMDLGETDKTLFLKAQKRKEELEIYKKINIPPIFTEKGLDQLGSDFKEEIKTNILEGIGVSEKETEGYIVCLENPYDKKYELKGKIVVTRTTDSSWTPIFGIIGGIITEIGGSLSHGAITAREMGIAGVVGVSEATKNLKTGMRVRINGIKGTVEIL